MNEELKQAVAEAVKAAMKETAPCRNCCEFCELDAGKHRDDHKFVFEMRQTLTDGRKQAFSMLFKFLAVALGLGLVILVGWNASKWMPK